MELLWQKDGAATVRDVLDDVNARRARPVAYTTVMTVMARLVGKGLLRRTLVGAAYRYEVSQSREEFVRQASHDIVADLVDDFGDAAIAGFLDTLDHLNPERVARLREWIARSRDGS